MEEQADGNCFSVAAQLVWQHDVVNRIHGEILGVLGFNNLHLCHGVVTRPDDQLQHLHAWVEGVKDERIWCIDFSNDNHFIVPADIYYQAGSIKNVIQYTRDQMLECMRSSNHYGPWNEEEKQKCLTSVSTLRV